MNRSPRTTVALIGLGSMGLRHVEALQLLVNLDLVAVCDLRPEAMKAPSIPESVQRHATADSLFYGGPYDLVLIATTAPSHKDMVLKAIDSGCPRILCEKPIACSLEDASDMVEAARTQGVRFSVNHARRFIPEYEWLSQQIQAGEWGALCSISASIPGIGLGCLGTHIVDLMRFLSGDEFDYVTGWVDRAEGPNPRGEEYIDPGGLVIGESARGSRFIYNQMESAAGPAHILIDLVDGRISIEEWNGRIEILALNRTPGLGGPRYSPSAAPSLEHFKPNVVHATAALIQSFVDHRGGGEFSCDAINGLRSLEVVVAAYASHDAAHRRVALPLSDSAVRKRRLPVT